MTRPLIVIPIAVLVIALFTLTLAQARDLGQWDHSPAIAEWFRSLMQPDNPGIPCCSFADAYYADKIVVRGDKAFAVITDDRPDEPLGRPHIDVGTEFEIPPNKLKWSSGNPVGHNLIFVSQSGSVYCFVQATGS